MEDEEEMGRHDRPLIDLNYNHRLCYDTRQWIVQKKMGKGNSAVWASRSFVATKSGLWQVLTTRDRDTHVVGPLYDTARVEIDDLPELFINWFVLYKMDPDLIGEDYHYEEKIDGEFRVSP